MTTLHLRSPAVHAAVETLTASPVLQHDVTWGESHGVPTISQPAHPLSDDQRAAWRVLESLVRGDLREVAVLCDDKTCAAVAAAVVTLLAPSDGGVDPNSCRTSRDIEREEVEGWARENGLLIIDSENDEQVEAAFLALNQHPLTYPNFKSALRSLIAPPKPEEPSGLGAVVIDKNGRRWVRIAADDDPVDPHLRTQLSPPWRSRGMAAKWWTNLHVVRVLSEGYTGEAS